MALAAATLVQNVVELRILIAVLAAVESDCPGVRGWHKRREDDRAGVDCKEAEVLHLEFLQFA